MLDFVVVLLLNAGTMKVTISCYLQLRSVSLPAVVWVATPILSCCQNELNSSLKPSPLQQAWNSLEL